MLLPVFPRFELECPYDDDDECEPLDPEPNLLEPDDLDPPNRKRASDVMINANININTELTIILSFC